MGDTSNQTVKKKVTKKKRKKGRRNGAQLSPELASKITKIGENEFNIDRSVIDQILEQQAKLMRGTRMRPVKNGDSVVAMRVSRVREGTLFDVLGVKSGDQLKAVNGFSLTDPQKALEAYGRLRSANRITLELNRGGKPTKIDFNIK